MHMMAYHAPEMIRKYGNLRQFSGQGMGTYIAVNYCLYMHIIGVEKNNDDAKHHYYSSNRHDAPKDILLTEARLEVLQRDEPKVVRKKRSYKKRSTEYWEKGITEQRRAKRLQVDDTSTPT